MIRAHVYSVEALETPQERAINDGLDFLAGYLGETIATRMLRIRLPQQPDGSVDVRRVGYGKLDKMVELHLMAVPLLGEQTNFAHGVAYMGQGVGYINTHDAQGLKQTRATAAHEAAHALGFLRPDARQRDIHNKTHCCSPDCIMHSHSGPSFESLFDMSKQARAKQTDLNGLIAELAGAFDRGVQQDFCKPCQRDFGRYGHEHINQLRTERLTNSGSVRVGDS
jgi:hypothetical protein